MERDTVPTVSDSESQGIRNPVNSNVLLNMLHEQRDMISLMQAQLDLQKERLDSQEKIITDLRTEVGKIKGSGETSVAKTSGTNVDLDWSTRSECGDISIADLVKQAAEETLVKQTSYVYDQTSGLYFDEASGYYYDPVQELFYNGLTRTYYKWDEATQKHVFHSQVPEESSRKSSKKKRNLVATTSKKSKITPSKSSLISSSSSSPKNMSNLSDVEDGELSDSTNSSGSETDKSDSDTIKSHQSRSTTSSRCREESLPCVRAVVMESSLPELNKGFLFVVTCMGGSIGREGDMHCILVEDPNVSKHHADIHFSNEDGKFYLTDLGSQNGTFLNGSRLSDAKVTSEAQEVLHGSTLKIGSTTLLIHIHPGSLTCALCEPGLNAATKTPIHGSPLTKEKKEQLRKKQLKKLRQKYCVEQNATSVQSKLPDSYTDRALDRRNVKGSDNPFEKTEVASMDAAIKEDNKGFKMLAKMGWNSGTSLGRSSASHLQSPLPAAKTEPVSNCPFVSIYFQIWCIIII
ncbi:unnamed protein product [Allacma fusca]|uniref:Angiogenic factor with G patch and FHA domains 1 n=1 Tax=Allacma fusca TaxID=39272 RepID=A0A8J2L8X4_9HEXA|nr:unnamed protein product [Allacma fusca]